MSNKITKLTFSFKAFDMVNKITKQAQKITHWRGISESMDN